MWSDAGTRFSKFEKSNGVILRQNRVQGILYPNDLSIVLEYQLQDQEEFIRILSPKGPGWIKSIFVESVTDES